MGPSPAKDLMSNRDNKLHVTKFFSSQLHRGQTAWFPCEIAALSIAASIKHFGLYIIQSHHRVCVVIDNKSCV